jgi:uncharacterized glyoxalase superfamily protein PhnB
MRVTVMPYKPEGYTSVAPYLIVKDTEVALHFIEQVFGGERTRSTPREDGTSRHAEIRIDDTVVMLGEFGEGQSSNVHVYVPDVDATIAKAVAAGGELVHDITEQGDGDRRGGVKDPSGTVWWISTQLNQR